MLAAQARATAKAAKLNSGEWLTAGGSAPSVAKTRCISPHTQRASSKLPGMFAALEMEDPSSSDEDECIGCETGVDCPQSHTCTDEVTSTWANVVRNGKPKDDDDDDDELPPLIFGRKTMTRWADLE